MKKFRASDSPLGERSLRGGSFTDGQTEASKLFFSSEGEGVKFGVWDCDPGKFGSHRKFDSEISYIISGTARVVDDETGDYLDVSEGDVLFIPLGWKGTWEISEPLRKFYISKKETS